MRVLRILAAMLTGLLFLAVLGVAGLAALLESGFFTPRILAAANHGLAGADLRVAWGALYWRPWSGINVEDVRLTSPGPDGAAEELLATVDEVEIGYRFMDFLSGRPQLRRVRLYSPAIDLPVVASWRERRADSLVVEETPDESRGRSWGGLIVEDVWITGARVAGANGTILSDLGLRGNLHGAEGIWSLTIDDAAAHVTAGHVNEEVELTGAVSSANGFIGVDGLHFTVGGGRVSFQGHIDPALREGRILTTGYAIPLERIASWFEFEHPLLTGALEFRFLTRGSADSLDVTGGLTGVADDGTGRDIVFTVRRRQEDVSIESLRVRTGDSQLNVTASLRLEDQPRVEGVATFHGIHPALLLAEEDLSPVTDLDGVVRFEGVGLSREEFQGSVEAEIESGAVFGWTFDTASLELAASRGNVTLRGARVTRGESVLTGAGTIDAVNHLVAEFTGTVADLGDVFAADGADTSRPATGQASAEVRLAGPLASPQLEAGFHFDDPSFHGVRARALDLAVRSDAVGVAELAIELTGRDVGYGAT
ncbi:MAG: AsmA family protein, partial [bacterium]